MQQQHERVDEPLRLGDCGLAVLELRHRLRQLGLVANDEITSSTERLDVFDQACDQAARSAHRRSGRPGDLPGS
jgi:hypothetical protein